jgi:predicted lactoylglutathione lyase
MPAIDHVTLEVPNVTEAETFYQAAFELGDTVQVRESQEPTTGFRGFTLSLVVSQPSTVDSLVGTALDAGASVLKPVSKTFWGYGGVVRAPDGTIWKVASSSKKDTGPTTRQVDEVCLLLGVADVKATKQFYAGRGLAVGKSFGSKYVEFDTPGSRVKLALYGRRALAKDAGVPEEGSGSHRIVVSGDGGPGTDLDGFVWSAD